MLRRNALKAALSGIAGLGVYAASIPFVKSFLPSARARALGDPIEIDLTRIAPGEVGSYAYRGRVMLVLHRTRAMLEQIESSSGERLLDSGETTDPGYVSGSHRSARPEYLVIEGTCTHLGCVPQKKDAAEGRSAMGEGWPGGFICPCHRSAFDYAGRVVQGPAPTNLSVPPHRYLSPTRLVIGEEPPPS